MIDTKESGRLPWPGSDGPDGQAHYAVVWLDIALLDGLLREGAEGHVRVKHGVPADAHLAGINLLPSGRVELTYNHPSFPAITPDNLPDGPTLDVTFETILCDRMQEVYKERFEKQEHQHG